MENIKTYKHGKKTIIVNKNNMKWIKLPSDLYEKIKKNKKYQSDFKNEMNKRYDFFKTNLESDIDIRSVYVTLTNKCNLSCDFCSMHSSPKVSTKDDMTIEEIKTVVIPKLQELNPKKIILTGGEPMIREDIIEIIKLFSFHLHSSKILLETNGILLTEDMVEFLSKHIDYIEISIENLFFNKQMMEDMKKKFDLICQQKMNLSLSFVVTKKNQKYLPKALDLIVMYHAEFSMRFLSHIGRAEELDQNMLIGSMDILKIYRNMLTYITDRNYFDENISNIFFDIPQCKKRCGAYGNILSIHCNGLVFMCANFFKDKYSLGNIKEHSINQIKKKLEILQKNEEIDRLFLVESKKECEKCEVEYFCTGPCAAENITYEDPLELESKTRCLLRKTLLKFLLLQYKQEQPIKNNIQQFIIWIDEVLKETGK